MYFMYIATRAINALLEGKERQEKREDALDFYIAKLE
jgi:hypothetical protein